MLAAPAAAVPFGVQPPEDPVARLAPAHRSRLGIHVVRPGLADGPGDVRGAGEHLARDASGVQTGSAEPALLDDGHVQIGEGVVDDGVAGSRTDDDKIVVAHPVSLRVPRPGRCAGALA
ncbi:hypothetical protein ACFXC2_24650, partial [Streptomyces lavendulae]|uniref:hypothetical protein n=1 Tax=Streptomyces lavendulae TaxID=1914 RepID=UPI0036C87FF9